MAIIIMSGSPGSGKSTVARLLAQRYERSVHLHTDDFWHMIVRGAIPPHLPESDGQNQTVVAAIAAAAFRYASAGFTTIVDGVVGPWMLHHYQREAARHAPIDMHYVVLRPDRETALRRAQERTNPGALVDAVPILSLWDQFADLGELRNHALDTTHLDAEETARAVSQVIERGEMGIRV